LFRRLTTWKRAALGERPRVLAIDHKPERFGFKVVVAFSLENAT
jgi:hypothetical protein